MTRNDQPTAGKRYASIFDFAEAAERGEEAEEEAYSRTRSELMADHETETGWTDRRG